MDQRKVITLEDRIPKLKKEQKQRANRRLIAYLTFFFLLLLTIVYFQSPLSDVKTIIVEGNHYVSETEIITASNIIEGTSFWGLNLDKAAAEINSLAEVSDATVKRKLPATIVITVKEYKRVAYLQADGKFLPLLSSGEILPQSNVAHFPVDAPLLRDFNSGSEELAEMAAELNKLSEALIERISEIYYTPNDSDPLCITLYMNDGYKVISTIRKFSEFISPYAAIVSELNPDEKGVIHMRLNPYFERFDYEEELEIES